jgi:hypothetical protein
MAFTEGTPLPNITTNQSQITTAPSWYTDYLKGIASAGNTAAENAQFVGSTPLQEKAFQNVSQNVGNYQPNLQAATDLATTAGNTDVSKSVSSFMNPYTEQVVGALETLGRRNIDQYLAPQATAAAVGSGQFGSKRGAEVLGNAYNMGLQTLNAAEAQALQQGYTQSLQAAQNQVANQLAGSQQLGNLANQTQSLGLGDVNALATLGGQQQTIGQNEQLFPLQAASQNAALLRGYSVPTSVASTYTGPIPGAYNASPLSQIAGVGSILGALSTTPAGGGKTSLDNLIGTGRDLWNWITG